MFGVYPDAFWESSLKKLSANEGYQFSLRRDLGGIATDPLAAHGSNENSLAGYPYFLAEAGGGMELAYHRRPVISADDVAALFVTHLGAGANLMAITCFMEGANPIGKRSTAARIGEHGSRLRFAGYLLRLSAPLGELGRCELLTGN